MIMIDLSACNHQMIEISFIDDKKCNYHQLFNYICEQIVNELKNSTWQEAYDFIWKTIDQMEKIDCCCTFSRMLRVLNVNDKKKRSVVSLLLHKKNAVQVIQLKQNVKNHQIVTQIPSGTDKEKNNQLRPRIRRKGSKSFVDEK